MALAMEKPLTWADYEKLPDDGMRYEIIEGVLFMSNAPAWMHQRAVMRLGTIIENLSAQLGRGGAVIHAPFEVHLSSRSRPVQPDLVYIAPEHMPAESPAFFEGAPDIVFEVISPSSVRVDRHIKFGAYEQAGVTEYWRIDPATRSVEVYVLARQEYALLGQFSGEAVARSQVLPELEVPVSELFAR